MTYVSPGDRAGATLEAAMKSGVRLVLIVLLILIIVGTLPAWPYSGGWGFAPSGGAGLVLLIIIILLVLGRI